MFIFAFIMALIAVGAYVWSFMLPAEIREPVRGRYGAPVRGEDGKVVHEVVGRPRRLVRLIALAAVLLGAVLFLLSGLYTQDAGEAKVQRSFTGALVGQTTEPGLHFKAPWVQTVTFDIRNQTVSYVGPAEAADTDHSGGRRTGPQITFQDREGVTGNLDVVVRYSIKPDAVLDIYREYQTQQNFLSRVITNDVRSVARAIPAKYNTIQVYNERERIGAELREALEERWASEGVIVEQVSLQEIRYSDNVRARFDEAQAARIAESRARAEQEVKRVEAESRIIEAQGIADANEILTESLTPEVLTQRYLEAIASGTVFVVPEGSTPLLNVQGGKPVAVD